MKNDPKTKTPPLQSETLKEYYEQIKSRPKRKYTQQELDERRPFLSLLFDRVFWAFFIDNKNNHLIKALVDALREIYDLPPIPGVISTEVQKVSIMDVLARGMIGDLLSMAGDFSTMSSFINIAFEVQRREQEGYAIRSILTSSNAMRKGFNKGDDYPAAHDVILGYLLYL